MAPEYRTKKWHPKYLEDPYSVPVFKCHLNSKPIFICSYHLNSSIQLFPGIIIITVQPRAIKWLYIPVCTSFGASQNNSKYCSQPWQTEWQQTPRKKLKNNMSFLACSPAKTLKWKKVTMYLKNWTKIWRIFQLQQRRCKKQLSSEFQTPDWPIHLYIVF